MGDIVITGQWAKANTLYTMATFVREALTVCSIAQTKRFRLATVNHVGVGK